LDEGTARIAREPVAIAKAAAERVGAFAQVRDEWIPALLASVVGVVTRLVAAEQWIGERVVAELCDRDGHYVLRPVPIVGGGYAFGSVVPTGMPPDGSSICI